MEAQQDSVDIHTPDIECDKLIIQYIYTRKLDLSSLGIDEKLSVLNRANYYQLDILIEDIIKHLSDIATPEVIEKLLLYYNERMEGIPNNLKNTFTTFIARFFVNFPDVNAILNSLDDHTRYLVLDKLHENPSITSSRERL